MAAIPPANLPNESAEWGRSVEDRLREVLRATRQNGTNVGAANQAASGAASGVATVGINLNNTQTDLAEKSKAPIAPTNFEVTSEGDWDKTGAPVAVLTATWDAVTVAKDSTTVVVTGYELWWKKDAEEYKRLTASTETHVTAVVAPGTVYTLKVRAMGRLGVPGYFSAEVQITTAFPLDILPKPSNPAPTTDKGTVTVPWDGKLVADDNSLIVPPLRFAYVYTVMSTTEEGAYAAVGQPLGRSGGNVVTTVDVGSTYWFKFYAVDKLGVSSPPSDAVSVVVQGVNVTDFSDDTKTYITENGSGNHITYSVDAPGAGTPEDKTGDTWFQRDPSNNDNIIGQWSYSGTVWVAQELSHEVIASIDLGKATVGELDAVHLKAGSIKTPQLAASAVTANNIDAGSGVFEMLTLGQTNSLGTPVNRVPAPLTDVDYWSKVLNKTFPLLPSNLGYANVSATATGILVAPTSSARSFVYFTTLLPIPESRTIYASIVQQRSVVGVSWRDAGGTYISNSLFPLAGGTVTAPVAAVTYTVDAISNQAAGQPASLISALSVFEVIGNRGTDQQSAQLSPAGLKLVTADGYGMIDLTTNTDQFFSISKDVGLGFEPQMSIDSDGTGTFTALAVGDDISINGDDLVGDFSDAQYNGNDYDGALLDRLARGTIYTADWGNPGSLAVTAQYQRLASGVFTVEDGRDYLIDAFLGGLQVDNSSGVNQYLEIRLSLGSMDIGSGGFRLCRAVIFNGTKGNFVFNPVVRSGVAGTTDLTVETLPAGVPIAWQLNTNASSAHSGFTLTQGGAQGRLAVIDVGATVERVSATDRSTSGNPVTPPASASTKTYSFNWSRSWNNSGSSIVTGSTQYFDKNMLYQGIGSTPYGARFGWGALGLSGRTATKVQVYLKNRWTESSGGVTAHLGASSNSSAPATFGSRQNAWDAHFNQGEGKWITVPKSLWNSIMSGAIRSFSIGVSSGGTDYSYFDGVGKSAPPKLKITYR